jgi:hypothetical protein
MNEIEMYEALDARLESLPREIAPGRELWPQIRERMNAAPASELGHDVRRTPAWWQLSAAVMLVTLSSLATYVVMRAQRADGARARAVQLVSNELAIAQFQPAGYMQARRELTAAFDESLARLSPGTRQVVESNLREIERSLKAINEALVHDPGNATLQQLLLAASTQELQYLDEVRRLALNVPAKGA